MKFLKHWGLTALEQLLAVGALILAGGVFFGGIYYFFVALGVLASAFGIAVAASTGGAVIFAIMSLFIALEDWRD